MSSRPILVISAGLRTAISSTLRAWLPVTVYSVSIMVLQFLTLFFLVSDEVFTKQTLQSSDGYWIAISMLAQTWLWVGLAKLSLNAIRGKPLEMSRLLAEPTVVFRFVVVSCVVVVAASLVVVSPVLLVLPVATFFRSLLKQEVIVYGVSGLLLVVGLFIATYLGLIFSQFPWLLFDDHARYFDALSQSKQLTKGSLWKLAIAFSVVTVFVLPGSLIYALVASYPDILSSLVVFLSLIFSWIWQVLLSAFGTFFIAAMYQQLLDRHSYALNESGMVLSPTT